MQIYSVLVWDWATIPLETRETCLMSHISAMFKLISVSTACGIGAHHRLDRHYLSLFVKILKLFWISRCLASALRSSGRMYAISWPQRPCCWMVRWILIGFVTRCYHDFLHRLPTVSCASCHCIHPFTVFGPSSWNFCRGHSISCIYIIGNERHRFQWWNSEEFLYAHYMPVVTFVFLWQYISTKLLIDIAN